MSFRERMSQPTSKAEDLFHARIQREGLYWNMHRGFVIELDEKRATRPDFCWYSRRIALYLDGRVVHGTRGARRRDERITRELEDRGWIVIRAVHNGRLTGEQEDTLIATLRELLG